LPVTAQLSIILATPEFKNLHLRAAFVGDDLGRDADAAEDGRTHLDAALVADHKDVS